MFTRPIVLKDRSVGVDKEPLTCTPLVGRDEDAVVREVDAVVGKQPDLIEWRVDFFGAIADTARVVALGRELRRRAGTIPIVFTRRSTREGGTPIALDEDGVLALCDAVCRSGSVDLLDWELSGGESHWNRARALCDDTGVRLVGSFHDFARTPPKAEIVAKFAAMQRAGADVAKVAVMPQHLRDVLTLLDATLEARETLDVPLISMSMGAFGSLSRLIGFVFGSTVSFAVGDKSSAPGQVPIADLDAATAIVRRALGR